MTDAEIIKCLECCLDTSPLTCKDCPMFNATNSTMVCSKCVTKFALDLINRQQAENDDLFYKLTGVMYSVDKWIDGDELKQDEVNRAATMREKTLQIMEKQQAEIEQWKEEANKYQKLWCIAIDDVDDIETAQSEAIKEFAKMLKKELGFGHYIQPDQIDNLVKEMVGEE